jgi:hypothetical protein
MSRNADPKREAILEAAFTQFSRCGFRSDLKAAGQTASAAAELVHLGATGLKQGASDVATLEKGVHGFVRVFFAGLRGSCAADRAASLRGSLSRLTWPMFFGIEESRT